MKHIWKHQLNSRRTCSLIFSIAGVVDMLIAWMERSCTRVLCLCWGSTPSNWKKSISRYNLFIFRKLSLVMENTQYQALICIYVPAFDFLLQGPITVPLEGMKPSRICDFTFALWIKLVDADYGGVKFQVYSPTVGTAIDISVSSDIRVILRER